MADQMLLRGSGEVGMLSSRNASQGPRKRLDQMRVSRAFALDGALIHVAVQIIAVILVAATGSSNG